MSDDQTAAPIIPGSGRLIEFAPDLVNRIDVIRANRSQTLALIAS
jgi:hypothetical protein